MTERRTKDFITPESGERLVLLQSQLESHITDFKKHEAEERLRWDHLISTTEANARSIHDLAEATKGVVEAWQTSTGVGRFVKWLSGFAVIGAAYAWWLKTFN